jgi:hypothetical protein
MSNHIAKSVISRPAILASYLRIEERELEAGGRPATSGP